MAAQVMTSARRPGIVAAIMSSPKTQGGEAIDARTLVLPVTVIVSIAMALIGLAYGFGAWSAKVNAGQEEAAATRQQMAAVQDQLSRMQGSLDALMGMQATLSQTRAEVGSLESRLDAFEIRIQTMDTWIQTTRQRMAEQGLDAPPYKP